MKLLFRLILTGAVILFLLVLFRPEFVANAGNAILNSVGSSKASGSAQVVPNNNGNGNKLQVTLQGLVSNLHYVVALEEGKCGGKVLLTIGGVSADKSGNVTSTFSLADLQSIAQKNVWVNVHQGNDPSGPSVACGQVLINSSSLSQVGTSTSSTSGTGTSSNQNTSSSANNLFGFPQTGVAPANKNSYDNYKFPRKR